ncbi:Cerato-platanin [Metarhizium album ARSEF 1941]|uniref:Cerato-platanin n=1 Tax=Metarhizium album (strain ARSEF 1941) TaxID=1081103 RepID=A0A0B2WMZ8_METAS|nr:Cerato-platanin [Metarhizium album ARSEF 1941]KHN94867.1 Cerato-platanin [Metarhizium album ARSEF 1941]
MLSSVAAVIVASAAAVSAGAIPKRSQTASMTPHDKYSSSCGALGCKINTNRIAYWPSAVSCNDICVKLTHNGRSLHLLKVDQSGGAHDISYDAYSVLVTGKPAAESRIVGGPVDMAWEVADPSACRDLLPPSGKLPVSAANSMNFISSCPASTWVGQNHELFNIQDPVCHFGVDQTCTLDMSKSNQPQCPSPLGLNTPLTGQEVYNIEYSTGNKVLA